MVFPVVMYGYELDYKEGWTPNNWCFQIVVLEKTLLRVPWTARRPNQSILKEINPECSLEALMLKLKLQYFGHLIRRADSLKKTLMLGKTEGRRRRGWGRDGWMASPAWWAWAWAGSRRWWRTGKPGVLQSTELQRVRHVQSDWTTTRTNTNHRKSRDVLSFIKYYLNTYIDMFYIKGIRWWIKQTNFMSSHANLKR